MSLHESSMHGRADSLRTRLSWAAVWGVLLVGVLGRVLFLDADPMHYAWTGYLTDEGRWTHQARELALFGSLDLSQPLATVHLALAPLYQAVTWISFTLWGVGFTSARLVSALSGVALLVAVLLFARRRMPTEALLVTLVALALQQDLVFLSRVAIPEMTLLLFEFFAFAMLVRAPRSARNAFAAGLLLAIGLGFKGTGLPMAAVLVAVIGLVHEDADPATRTRKAGAFLAAIAASALAALGLATLLTDAPVVSELSGAASLLGVATPYGAVSLLMYESSMPSIRTFLFAAWTISGVLVCAGRLPASPARSVFVGSAAWGVAWVALSLSLGYFPERYAYHGLVPLALSLGSGVALLQAHGRDALARAIDSAGPRRRWIAAAWIALPPAILLTPVVLASVQIAGWYLDRLHQHLALVLMLHVALTVLVARRWRADFVLYRVVAPTLILALVALLARDANFFDGAFWRPGGVGALVRWVLLFGITAALSRPWWTAGRRGGARRRFAYDYLALWVTISLAQIAPTVLDRSYTARETAEELEALLGEEEVVWTDDAAGLLLGTRLRFREDIARSSPDVIVGMYRPAQRAPSGHARYDLVARYPIAVGVSQEYLDRHGIDPFVRVFRRVPES